ncbi:beta-propeller domain-containing protein [Nocardioides guangzhouensis]|nr:beta-propeller domain-containing protein [Nocardioides guangzhouensis]
MDRPSPLTRPAARRWLAVTAAVALVGGSFAAGAVWRGGGDEVRSGRLVAAPLRPLPQAPGVGLVSADSCDQLLDWYVDHALDRVTAWGWDGGPVYLARDGFTPMAGAAEDTASAGRGPDEVTSSDTGTNVQEQGVDEPDVAKTDGDLMVRVGGDTLTTYDVTGTEPRLLSTYELPGVADQRDLYGYGAGTELLLVGDTAVVLGSEGPWYDGRGPRTTVVSVDLSSPGAPTMTDRQTYGAELVSARRYGDAVRLVFSSGLPDLPFVHPSDKRSDREARAHNRAAVRASTLADWLPSVHDEGGARTRLADCDQVRLPEDFSGPGTMAVVGYDATTPRDRSVTAVATSSTTVYSSTDRLYLATSAGWGIRCCVMVDAVVPGWPGRDGTTQLHAFALSGDAATYLGSGEVDGSVRDRWAMDATDGVLRVAVGPTSETGNFNSVLTLAERDGRLVQVGRVDRLGVNEEIKSVRWFDDLAFVVTFRQTDPLYAIDLSDPAHPRRLGALKIPGYSEYLHPIGDDRLLGIGTDAGLDGSVRGGQAAVFDVSDLAAPRRVSVHTYGSQQATRAGQDPRQFTWLPDRRTALTVVESWGPDGGSHGTVSLLHVGPGGQLTERSVHGAYGYADVAALRTLPLPDGRVVVTSPDTTRLLTP